MVQRVHPPRDGGFVLPLSITGALVLLLSSLSLQTLVLQTRQVQASQRMRLRADDRLASAAHRVAAAFQGRFACLQAVPLADWRVGALPTNCPGDLDPRSLQRLSIDGQVVHLAAWEPQQGGGALRLQQAVGGLTRRYWLGASGVKELG